MKRVDKTENELRNIIHTMISDYGKHLIENEGVEDYTYSEEEVERYVDELYWKMLNDVTYLVEPGGIKNEEKEFYNSPRKMKEAKK